MHVSEYPLFLGGKPHSPNQSLKVVDKFSGECFATAPLADDGLIDRAVAAAAAAAPAMAALAPFERADRLRLATARLGERAEALALLLTREVGKPIRDSRTEVARMVETFRLAAEEATRIGGEVLPLDVTPRARGYRGFWKRVPLGPCSFISPFNFPLNLTAHKVAPALAAGCPFVLKPASLTPLSALELGKVLTELDLPDGAFSILPCSRGGAERFTSDPRLKLLSFTGSPAVGWELKNRAGKKKVVLELGGNAACIVDETADESDALNRLLVGTFSQSGQSCISVQRILVHRSRYDSFRDRLVTAVRALPWGDPRKDETVVGPLISESEAQRLERWIADAVSAGGRVLCGGERKGALLSPTLLENVPKSADLCRQEAFGPIAVLSAFDSFDGALSEVNDSPFGLQAGVFTRDLHRAHRAWDVLEVGGVVIGDVPSWRADHMPYGGVKESGLGREGVRFAVEDMTELRMLVVRTPV